MAISDSSFLPPRCVFVTGPRGPGKSRWFDERVAQLQAQRLEARIAVLLADEGLTHSTRFADWTPKVPVRCVYMPCLCCPGAADLPRAVRTFAEATRAECLFIEIPALAAEGLIAEFDHVLGWSREVIVWVNSEWTRARRAQTLSIFQTRLLALADCLVEQPATRPATRSRSRAPTLSLT